jgi:hypothetical protein
MSKVITAKYDADRRELKLVEPLEGVQNHETVRFMLLERPDSDPARPWLAFSGCMAGENGDDFARAIEEMFPNEQ